MKDNHFPKLAKKNHSDKVQCTSYDRLRYDAEGGTHCCSVEGRHGTRGGGTADGAREGEAAVGPYALCDAPCEHRSHRTPLSDATQVAT